MSAPRKKKVARSGPKKARKPGLRNQRPWAKVPPFAYVSAAAEDDRKLGHELTCAKVLLKRWLPPAGKENNVLRAILEDDSGTLGRVVSLIEKTRGMGWGLAYLVAATELNLRYRHGCAAWLRGGSLPKAPSDEDLDKRAKRKLRAHLAGGFSGIRATLREPFFEFLRRGGAAGEKHAAGKKFTRDGDRAALGQLFKSPAVTSRLTTLKPDRERETLKKRFPYAWPPEPLDVTDARLRLLRAQQSELVMRIVHELESPGRQPVKLPEGCATLGSPEKVAEVWLPPPPLPKDRD